MDAKETKNVNVSGRIPQIPSKLRLEGKFTDPAGKLIEEKRENTAGWLAIGSLVIFAITILAPLVALILAEGNISSIEGLLEFIKVILPAETALLGMSFGFYFSQSRLKSKSD